MSTSPNLHDMLTALAGIRDEEKKKNVSEYMAVYCQSCGHIDENVSKTAVKVILEMTQQEFATIECKQCGQKIAVNLNEDLMKVGKNGKYKLKDTSQW